MRYITLFRACRELRSLNAHNTRLRVELRAAVERGAQARLEPRAELGAERVAERGVRDDARALEEGRRAHALRAVDRLAREREVARRDLFAQ